MKCWDIALLQQLGILDERYEGCALYCLRQRHRAVLAAVRDVARGQDQGRLAGKCRRLNRHRKARSQWQTLHNVQVHTMQTQQQEGSSCACADACNSARCTGGICSRGFLIGRHLAGHGVHDAREPLLHSMAQLRARGACVTVPAPSKCGM